MPDLHGWLTQRVDEIEQGARLIEAGGYAPQIWHVEPTRSGRWMQIVSRSRLIGEPAEAARREDDQPVALVATGRNEHQHIIRNDPVTVLRRCESDRRILARHNTDPAKANSYEATACSGCGTYGDCDWPETENINDCPELLDLAHAHGLTDEILTQLDRPQAPRPKRRRPHVPVLTLADIGAVPTSLRGPDWTARGGHR